MVNFLLSYLKKYLYYLIAAAWFTSSVYCYFLGKNSLQKKIIDLEIANSLLEDQNSQYSDEINRFKIQIEKLKNNVKQQQKITSTVRANPNNYWLQRLQEEQGKLQK